MRKMQILNEILYKTLEFFRKFLEILRKFQNFLSNFGIFEETLEFFRKTLKFLRKFLGFLRKFLEFFVKIRDIPTKKLKLSQFSAPLTGKFDKKKLKHLIEFLAKICTDLNTSTSKSFLNIHY